MFTKPVTLVWCVGPGSAMERGTEPSAAWCSTMSTCLQAVRQAVGSAMLPSMKRCRRQACGPTACSTSSRFRRCPVAKLSRLTTLSPRRSSTSTRCEPMKPADPVTSQVFTACLERSQQLRGFLLLRYPVIKLGELLELLARRRLAPGLEQRLGEVEPDVVCVGRQLGCAAEELEATLGLSRAGQDRPEGIHDLRAGRRKLMGALSVLERFRALELVRDPGEVVQQHRVFRHTLECAAVVLGRALIALGSEIALRQVIQHERVLRVPVDPFVGERLGLGALAGCLEYRMGAHGKRGLVEFLQRCTVRA